MNKHTLLLISLFWVITGCSNSDDSSIPDEQVLTDVVSEVLFFEFTPDTGNNSSRLRYEIEFKNPNKVAIKGFYRIKTVSDGLSITAISTNLSPCYQIGANERCTVSFDEEQSFDVGRTNLIQLISVEYNIAK